MREPTDGNLRGADPRHEALYKDFYEVLRKHTEGMTPIEMLAIAANMVGKILAMQDQRAITLQAAMEVIIKNIEYGNQTVIQDLRSGSVAGSA